MVSDEREDTTRLAVVAVADPWPTPLCDTVSQAVPDERTLERHGDEWGVVVSPDGTAVLRTEIRVADAATGAVRALTGTPLLADRSPVWSPDGTTLAFCSERSGWYELHLVGADGSGERQPVRVNTAAAAARAAGGGGSRRQPSPSSTKADRNGRRSEA